MLSTGSKAVLNAVSTPVLLMDSQGRILFSNRRARALMQGRVPMRFTSLLENPSRINEFYRTARRNRHFLHLTSRLLFPLEDYHAASSRLIKDGQLSEDFLIELVPRDLAVGGILHLSKFLRRATDLKRGRALAQKHARLALSEANRDSLTGLANRRAFNEWLEACWKQAVETRGALSLLIVDLDFFKKINDGFGHDVGDQVLSRVAKLLNGAMTRKEDRVARIGGEEFAVLLPGADVHAAMRVAWRLVMSLRDYNRSCPAGDNWQPVTLSVGVATRLPGPGDSSRDMVKEADASLYLAKKRGRDQAVHSSLSSPGGAAMVTAS